MKLTIYKYPEEEETFIWIIDIKERYTDMWYNEISRRYLELKTNPNIKIFDIDESYELWQISLWHLEEMIKFLKENIK